MELKMSQRERDRMKLIEQIVRGHLSTAEAAAQLGRSQRQVQRMVVAYRRRGDRALVHGLRGRRPNNAMSHEQLEQVKILLKQDYQDCGPTFTAEHLQRRHGLRLSRETVRRLMIRQGLWNGARKGRPHRKRRPRRARFGELVQIDTSDHDWLEGRGPQMVLITMIDDATGIKRSDFAPADTTETNMALIEAWMGQWGRPVAIYCDWASHFKQPQARGCRPAQTQIERALAELDVKLIAAHSPQAKGRVERSHGTDQDRLIKELRLEGICTLEGARAHLKHYLARVNGKFAVEPTDPLDAHRSSQGFDLEAIVCVHERRRVMNDWTVRIDNRSYQIEPGERTGALAGRPIVVERRRNGSLRLRWQDRYLKFHQVPDTRRAVEMTARGQISEPPATRAEICPPALDNAARCPQFHSHDDDELMDNELKEEIEALHKPVRIPNRTRKPKPQSQPRLRRRHF